MLNKILSLFLIFFLFSCSKEEKATNEIKSGIDIEVFGTLNYGGLVVGEFKDASVKIINYDKSEVLINDIGLDEPFKVVSYSSSCSNRKIQAESFCIVAIRFQPNSLGVFEDEISLKNKKVKVSGRGLENGVLFVDSDTWDLGVMKAGEIKTKKVTLQNLGDSAIKSPTITKPNYFFIEQNTCGTYIVSKSSCFITFRANPTLKQVVSNTITLDSGVGGLRNILISGEVKSNKAAGLITFQEALPNIKVGGVVKNVTTNPIKDAYGNIIEDGETVSFLVTNNLSIIGEQSKLSESGLVEFTFRTLTSKGEAAIQINSGDASGYEAFQIISNLPFGTIELSSIPNEIVANGLAQNILRTNVIKDQYNNVVEDGTVISFSTNCSGKLSNGNNPKDYDAVTINGQASVVIQAGVVAESCNLIIFANPILDTNSEVVGYAANGLIPLKFIPGPGFGGINLSSSLNSIYAERIPPASINYSGITVVSLGPIKDKELNIVTLGTDVEIEITNGYYLSGSEPTRNAIIKTDENGFAYFTLSGDGTRGDIIVSARSGFATGQLSVRTFKQVSITYNENNNPYSMSYIHHKADELPPIINNWIPIESIRNIQYKDEKFYGYEKESDFPKYLISNTDTLPKFKWDCFFTGGDFLFSNICLDDNNEYNSFFVYNRNHDLYLESLSDTNSENLLPNPLFVNNNQSWDQNGGTHSTNYGGTIVVRNTIIPEDVYLLDNFYSYNTEQLDDRDLLGGLSYQDIKGDGIESVWIPIDSSKKYLISAIMVARGGQKSEGVISYIESSNGYEDPLYEIIDLPIRAKGNINIENQVQRAVVKFNDGVEAVKIVLSTAGFGVNNFIYWDNVSLSELSNDNIYDVNVDKGVQLAYSEKADKLIMVGGNKLVYDNIYNEFTFLNNEKNTLVSNLQNSVIGISKQDINSGIPESGIWSGFVSVDDVAYHFGGINLSSMSISSDLRKFDFNSKEWSVITPNRDLSLVVEDDILSGTPRKRFGHSMVYAKIINKIFIAGGMVENYDNESTWSPVDDLWSYNLLTNSWKRECQHCMPLEDIPNFKEKMARIELFPENVELKTEFIELYKQFTPSVMEYHNQTNKIVYFSPNTYDIKVLDPNSLSFTEKENSEFKNFPAFSEFKNSRKTGRTFLYQKGTDYLKDSKLYYWDMNPDNKEFIKSHIFLGSDVKSFIKELKINVFGYGTSVTNRLTGNIESNGLEVHVYNQQTQLWEYVSDNNIKYPEDVLNNPIEVILNSLTSNYVSLEGYVDILISAKGRPGFDGGGIILGDDLPFLNLNGVINASGNSTNNCILLNNSVVNCYGSNISYQLGIGDNNVFNNKGDNPNEIGVNSAKTSLMSSATQSSGLEILKVYSGGKHHCALFNNNRIKCWGDNQYGQLGYGNQINVGGSSSQMGDNLVFVDIGNHPITSNPHKIIDLSMGEDFTCALIEFNNIGEIHKVKCWGRNDKGQLGLNFASGNSIGDEISEMGDSLPFLDFGSFYDVNLSNTRNYYPKKVDSGLNHSCALMENNVVKCWGSSEFGATGNDTTSDILQPTIVNLNAEIISQISIGSHFSCAIEQDLTTNKLFCWGRNNKGQLGKNLSSEINIGDNDYEIEDLTPTFTSEEDIEIYTGNEHSCIKTNDVYKCWGDNQFGQSGQGDRLISGTDLFPVDFNSMQPSTIGDGILIDKFMTLFDSTCGISYDQKIKCWGKNSNGQLGQGDMVDKGVSQPLSSGKSSVFIDYISVEGLF